MKTTKTDSIIDYVVYKFRKNTSLHIDVIPIGERFNKNFLPIITKPICDYSYPSPLELVRQDFTARL